MVSAAVTRQAERRHSCRGAFHATAASPRPLRPPDGHALASGPAAFPAVEEDCAEEDETAGDVLVAGRDIEEVHRVLNDAHDEHARDDEGHAADAAGERDAAEHTGGDHVEFEAHGGVGLAARQTGSEDDAREGGHHALGGENDDFDAVHGDPGQVGSLGVAADGERVAAKDGALQNKAEDEEAPEGNPDRSDDAEEARVAELEEVLVDDADGFVVGDDQAEAAHDLHGGERGDERVDAEFGDDVAVDEAGDGAARESGDHTEQDAIGAVHHERGHHTGAGDDGADREVEVAGGEAEQHRAGDHARHRDREGEALHVAPREEIFHEERAAEKQDREDDEHAGFVEEIGERGARGRECGGGRHGGKT